MSKSKSLASLTPTLLARKGLAKPAMRPQFQHVQEATAQELEDDLGFNDMGHDHALGEVVELKPFVAERPAGQGELRRTQKQASSRINKNAPDGKSSRSDLTEGRRAAFTLRLDADRHLELRLASALAGRSAQQLLTDALDQMIKGLPEVADFAARAGKRN
ncbi:MAG: hypothetical protein ABIM50_08115 [Novosphingobium sp.]